MRHDSRAFRFHLAMTACVLLACSTPLAAQADVPVRALPLPSAPHAPSFPAVRPLAGSEYRLDVEAYGWPKDPAVGGLLGGAIGCASGVVLAYLFSSRDRRTRNAGSGCLLLGAVGMGAGSGWRVPGEDYFRTR